MTLTVGDRVRLLVDPADRLISSYSRVGREGTVTEAPCDAGIFGVWDAAVLVDGSKEAMLVSAFEVEVIEAVS